MELQVPFNMTQFYDKISGDSRFLEESAIRDFSFTLLRNKKPAGIMLHFQKGGIGGADMPCRVAELRLEQELHNLMGLPLRNHCKLRATTE